MTAFTLKAAPVQQGLFIASSYDRRPPPQAVTDKRQADMFAGGTVVMDLVNNTGIDLRDFEAEIRAALVATGAMPEELADVISARIIEKNGRRCAVLECL